MKANAGKRKIFDAVDLLTEDISAQTTEVKAENGVEQIAIDSIKAFHNHPFHLYEGERLKDMVESIREHGVLNPVIVLKTDDGYEMLSGHNRANAAKLAGLTEVPAIVKVGLSEAEAYVYVIETNLMQRSFAELLPSEKAAVMAAHYDKVCCQGKRSDYKPTKNFIQMMSDNDFYEILQELVEFGIHRFERNYKDTYGQTDLVLYQKYTYEDVCRLLNWEQNEVPLNIGGYKFDKKTKTFPVFINYDKSENISDTTKYEDHFVPGFRDRLIAISKSGRSLQSEDVQNFLKAKERGIQVELFVRKNKDDKISKEFYYLGHMTASGNTKEFTMVNTEKTAVEIEWVLDIPVREDIYEYIVNS